ncbi:MAG: hypothetical protein KAR06_11035 [Deltaproteobacteria bacterium]|nr:hypothetical protein [Deltaproteobacteria bacterium]
MSKEALTAAQLFNKNWVTCPFLRMAKKVAIPEYNLKEVPVLSCGAELTSDVLPFKDCTSCPAMMASPLPFGEAALPEAQIVEQI